MRLSLLTLALATLAAAPAAGADRGGLTLDAGGGGTATLLPPPTIPGFTVTPARTPVGSAAAWVGVRYGLSNHLEVAASGFYEPPVQVYENGVTLSSDSASLPGTLAHRYQRFGALLGVRWMSGSVWRFVVGADLGWTRRTFSQLVHINDTTAIPTDYHLGLQDVTFDSPALAVTTGLEWAVTENFSVRVLPRMDLVLGQTALLAVTLPITVSYSWYL